MTACFLHLKDIKSGQFKIDDLKQFSINTGFDVLIVDYAVIRNGKLNYLGTVH
jgi:hypothetical protein